MSEVLQLLVNGVAIGCIYALIGFGFLVAVNGTRLINLAHGEILMIGAFLAVSVVQQTGLPLVIAYLIAIIGTMAFGYILNLVILRPLIGKPFFTVLVATLGLGIMLTNLSMNIWGPDPLNLPGPFGTQTLHYGNVVVAKQSLLAISVTVAVFLAQWWFFNRTLTGRQMRAMADQPEAAQLVGIPVRKLTAFTFMLSAALAGLAGILIGPLYYVSFSMGNIALLKGFTAAIIGGFGRVEGAVIGGITLGVVETMMAAYVSPTFKDGFAFMLLILVLMVLPRGILGQRVTERI